MHTKKRDMIGRFFFHFIAFSSDLYGSIGTFVSLSTLLWHLSFWHMRSFCSAKNYLFFQFIAISELYRSIGIYVTSWRPLRHLLFDTLDLKNFLFLSECSNLIHFWRLCSLSVSTKGALLWVNICGSIIDSKGLYPQITLKLKDKISGQVEMIHLIISQNFFLLVQGQELLVKK